MAQFLDGLEARLEPDTLLLRGLDSYTVMPARLADDRGSAWFWRRLFALQEHHHNPLVQDLCAVLFQGNNVIKVGISSDRRYGPILNYELSLKISRQLASIGFRPRGKVRLVLLGYSGGGEMAMGVASYLQRVCRCRVSIITVCGVFSGANPLDAVDGITMVVGSRDPVAAFGRIAYPGRSPLLPFSRWNRLVSRGGACVAKRSPA